MAPKKKAADASKAKPDRQEQDKALNATEEYTGDNNKKTTRKSNRNIKPTKGAKPPDDPEQEEADNGNPVGKSPEDDESNDKAGDDATKAAKGGDGNDSSDDSDEDEDPDDVEASGQGAPGESGRKAKDDTKSTNRTTRITRQQSAPRKRKPSAREDAEPASGAKRRRQSSGRSSEPSEPAFRPRDIVQDGDGLPEENYHVGDYYSWSTRILTREVERRGIELATETSKAAMCEALMANDEEREGLDPGTLERSTPPPNSPDKPQKSNKKKRNKKKSGGY